MNGQASLTHSSLTYLTSASLTSASLTSPSLTSVPPSLLCAMLDPDNSILCLNSVIRRHFLPSVCASHPFSSSQRICHDSQQFIETLHVVDVCVLGRPFPRLRSLTFHHIGDFIVRDFVYTNRSVLTTLKITFQKNETWSSTIFLHNLPPTLRVFVQNHGTFRVDPSKQIPSDIRGQECAWPAELQTLKLNETLLSVHENAEKSFAWPKTLRKLCLNYYFPICPWYFNFPANLISLKLNYWDSNCILPPNLREFTFHYRKGSPETIAFPPNLQILRIKKSGQRSHGRTKMLTTKDDFSDKLPASLRQLICPYVAFTNSFSHLPEMRYLEIWRHSDYPMLLQPPWLDVVKIHEHSSNTIIFNGDWYHKDNTTGWWHFSSGPPDDRMDMSDAEMLHACERRRKKWKQEIMEE